MMTLMLPLLTLRSLPRPRPPPAKRLPLLQAPPSSLHQAPFPQHNPLSLRLSLYPLKHPGFPQHNPLELSLLLNSESLPKLDKLSDLPYLTVRNAYTSTQVEPTWLSVMHASGASRGHAASRARVREVGLVPANPPHGPARGAPRPRGPGTQNHGEGRAPDPADRATSGPRRTFKRGLRGRVRVARE